MLPPGFPQKISVHTYKQINVYGRRALLSDNHIEKWKEWDCKDDLKLCKYDDPEVKISRLFLYIL